VTVDSHLQAEQVRADIQHLRRSTDVALRETWDRSLPFADALFDRWERARSLGFGEGTSVYDSAALFGSVHIGDETWVGPNTLLDGSGAPLTIGSHCNISAGVQIYTHDSSMRCVSLGALDLVAGAVSLGDGTYIGSQSIVSPNVNIGSRCIIGANSFVNADVPDRTVVAGSPARPIGRVVGDGAATHIQHLAHSQDTSDPHKGQQDER